VSYHGVVGLNEKSGDDKKLQSSNRQLQSSNVENDGC